MTSTCSLQSIAADVVGQYRDATQQLVAAYRVGASRTIAGVSERYEQFLGGRRTWAFMSQPEDTKHAEPASPGWMVTGVMRISDTTGEAVERVSKGMLQIMGKLGEQTAWTNDLTVLNGLRNMSMPAAMLSLRVAKGVNDATRRIAERVAKDSGAEATNASTSVEEVKGT